MRVVRCPKCGSTVCTDDALLRELTEAIDAATRRANRSRHPGERAAITAEVANLRSMYKQYMHHLTSAEHAKAITPTILRDLRKHILSNGLMTEAELEVIYRGAEASARARLDQESREIQRLYGDFRTMSNRAAPDPTADKALRHCR